MEEEEKREDVNVFRERKKNTEIASKKEGRGDKRVNAEMEIRYESSI